MTEPTPPEHQVTLALTNAALPPDGWSVRFNFADCPRCHAMVRPEDMEAHAEWHENWNGGR